MGILVFIFDMFVLIYIFDMFVLIVLIVLIDFHDYANDWRCYIHSIAIVVVFLEMKYAEIYISLNSYIDL